MTSAIPYTPAPPPPPPSQPPPPQPPPPQQQPSLSAASASPQFSAADGSSAPSSSEAATASPQRAAVLANSFRLTAVVERLALYFSGLMELDKNEVFHLWFALARGIDYALTNKDIPKVATRLPPILKEVYQRRNDTALQSAATVLMISAKNACQSGWFHTAETGEILSMANELCSSFCMEVSVSTEAGNALDVIRKIMPRYYPQLKFGRLISSFDAKPGYDILMADFIIEKNIPPDEKILLFVVQTDHLDTSSCIISPQHVSFLVNGRGVERRTNVSQDSGPQFPTDITKMLKYGTNIIQAIGYFTGNYIIAIAFVAKGILPPTPALKDYVQPVVAALASDSEIVEGPSRISLDCRISFKRIKTPVKGHLCKHLQCFDYDNFIEMNSRKPSWRCPCCNQPACFLDLRVDQNMVKILEEVHDDVGDVIIYADGSWKVAGEHNGSTDQLHNGAPAGQENGDMEYGSYKSSCILTEAVDLTMEEDGGNDIINGYVNQNDKSSCQIQDRKPFGDIQGFPVSSFTSAPPARNPTTTTSPSVGSQIANIWSRVLSSVSTASSVPIGSGGCADQTSESRLNDVVMTPVITDAVSPALNRNPVPSLVGPQPISLQHASQVRHRAENFLLQQPRFGSSIIGGDIERVPIPRNVSRNPVAIQALPVQTQTSIPPRRTQTNLLSQIPNIPNSSLASNHVVSSDGFSPGSDMEMHNVPWASEIPITQNRDYQDLRQIWNPTAQQVVGLPASNLMSPMVQSDQQRGLGSSRAPLQPYLEHQNSQTQTIRTHHSMNHATGILPQSSGGTPLQDQQASNAIGSVGGNLVSQHASFLATKNIAAQGARMLGGTVNTQTSRSPLPNSNQRIADGVGSSGGDHLRYMAGLVPPAARADGSQGPSAQNWRPTGRMRGSLTGSAYSAALNQYMVPTSQNMSPRSAASTGPTSDTGSLLVSNLNSHVPFSQQASMRRNDKGNQSGA